MFSCKSTHRDWRECHYLLSLQQPNFKIPLHCGICNNQKSRGPWFARAGSGIHAKRGWALTPRYAATNIGPRTLDRLMARIDREQSSRRMTRWRIQGALHPNLVDRTRFLRPWSFGESSEGTDWNSRRKKCST
jgi:hypothetical protein